jgi:catechol 2,3-dioxygenase-like lactoylglutathione lyase family enzyme
VNVQLTDVDHVGIVVAALEAASAFFEGVFGLAPAFRADSAHFRTAFFDCGATRIEALEPRDETTRATRLGAAPARVDHVAFVVPDLDEAVAALAERGIEATPQAVSEGRRTCWTVPATSGGLIYQLIEPRST